MGAALSALLFVSVILIATWVGAVAVYCVGVCVDMESLIKRMQKLGMDSVASTSLLSNMAKVLADEEAKAKEKRFLIRVGDT